MGIIFRTRAEDLMRCRFAVSPLGETADAIRSLAWPAAAPGQLAWQRQISLQLPGLQIRPLTAILVARGYQPDFLSPAPPGPLTAISAELDQMRATPPQQVAAEFAWWQALNPAAPGTAGSPGTGRRPGPGQGPARQLLHRVWQG